MSLQSIHSPQSPFMSLFRARIPNCIKSSIPLISSDLGQFFSLSQFFMTTIFLKNIGEVLHRMSVSSDLSWDSLWLNWSYEFWGKLHWGEIPIPPYHFKGSWYHHDLWLVILTLITWLRWVCHFSTIKLVFFTFPPLFFGNN